MVERIRAHPAHPALKHGGYSGISLLPGENPAEFEKLRRELIAEYVPVGRSEEDEVAKLAHYMWRRMHLGAYQQAKQMRRRRDEIFLSLCPRDAYATRINGLTAAERGELTKAADEQARNELGSSFELVELGDVTTLSHLLEEIAVAERLDGLIDRCLKRLLFIHGLKSLSLSPSPPAAGSSPQLTHKAV